MASSAILHALLPLAILHTSMVGPACATAGAGTALLLGGDNYWDFRLGPQPTSKTSTVWIGSKNRWETSTPKLNVIRGGSLAVKLKATGDILIAGGRTPVASFDFATRDPTDPVRSAETLAKGARKWRYTSNMKQARTDHGITTIAKGKLGAMVAGGVGAGQDGPTRGFIFDDDTGGLIDKDIAFLKTVELYNVKARKWFAAAPMPTSRAFFQLIKLGDGNSVLAPGGQTRTTRSNDRNPGGVTRTVDVYDIRKNTWKKGPNLNYRRENYAWVPTVAGGAMIIGGGSGVPNQYAEVYHPRSKSWKKTRAHILPRTGVAAALLPSRVVGRPRSGKVIIIGGVVGNINDITATTEIWDPATNAWTAGPSMKNPRAGASVARLANGDLLVAGGFKFFALFATNIPVDEAEIYDAKLQKFRHAGILKGAHFNGATLLTDPFGKA